MLIFILMPKIKKKILLVEDDANLGFIIQDFLQMKGYFVELKKDGLSGLEIFKKKRFDLCILDIMLPKMDGFSLAKEIRKNNQKIPFIFLTAKTLQDDIIKGLKIGADDYITKPFSTEELKLRIEIIFRRQNKEKPGEEETIFYLGGKYIFDYNNRILKTKTTEHHLTKREADVLKLLCRQRGKLVKREDALKDIWGADDYFMGRSMDVYITKLRKYLKEDNSIIIKNIHGSGFKLEIINYKSPE